MTFTSEKRQTDELGSANTALVVVHMVKGVAGNADTPFNRAFPQASRGDILCTLLALKRHHAETLRQALDLRGKFLILVTRGGTVKFNLAHRPASDLAQHAEGFAK